MALADEGSLQKPQAVGNSSLKEADVSRCTVEKDMNVLERIVAPAKEPVDPTPGTILLVLIDQNGNEVPVELSKGADGDYTTTYTFDYETWGSFYWDPSLSVEENEGPYVPFYFVINGKRYGADEAMHETALGYAMENPLVEDGEGCYCVPVGFTYTLGVAYKDGVYYVYAAISQIYVPSPYMMYGHHDFNVDGIYYRKNGPEVSVSFDSIFVDVYDNWYDQWSWKFVYHNYSYANNDVLTIPEYVVHEGIRYDVTGIQRNAFLGTKLNGLTLSNTLKDISNTGCEYLAMCKLEGQGSWETGPLHLDPVQLCVNEEITSIKGLGVAPDEVFCHAKVPPVCDELTFNDYHGILHVPATSLAAYFTAPYWSNFSVIRGDVDIVEPPTLRMSVDSLTVASGTYIDNHVKAILENGQGDHELEFETSDYNVVDYNYAYRVGECDYTAKYGNLRATCHIKVNSLNLGFNHDTLSLNINDSQPLTAVPDTSGICYDKDRLFVFSTNPDIATIQDGVVTAIASGQCDIVLAYGDVGLGVYDECGKCHVIVNQPPVQITLDQHEASVLPNHMLILTPSTSPVWTDLVVTSSHPEIAAARMSNGKIQVVGIVEGETTVTVASLDGLALTDSCKVTVYTEAGDVNCDGYVNISDVVLIIDYLQTGDETSLKLANADVDNNGEVSIKDVVSVIDSLLLSKV